MCARAEALPDPDPVYNLQAAKRQASITSHFRKYKRQSWQLHCSLALAKIGCERPRWFLSLARSVETLRVFLFLGWFLIWVRFLKLRGGGG